MYEAVVIADDFTGANDTGIQLKKYGYDTVVLIDFLKFGGFDKCDAVVMDTESRAILKDNAYDIISNISKAVGQIRPKIIYKKVDSTLRGNISTEVKAICDSIGVDIVVFSPAYPQMGRTTVNGVHLLNSVPIDRTELSKDPKNPVKTSNLKEILTENFDIPCVKVDLDALRGDFTKALRDAVLPCAFIFDAETYDDLKKILEIEEVFPEKKILWVGSAGLANALFEKRKKSHKPVLSIVGSVNSVSIEQYKYAVNEGHARGVVIDAISLLKNKKDELDKILNEIDIYLEYSEDVVVTTVSSRADYEKTLKWGAKHQLDTIAISERIASSLGELVFAIMKKHKLSGLFVTGGDVAISVIKKLSADGSRVICEIETGVPLLKVYGGPYDGTNLVTKAGGFGNKETICNAIKHIKGISV